MAIYGQISKLFFGGYGLKRTFWLGEFLPLTVLGAVTWVSFSIGQIEING